MTKKRSGSEKGGVKGTFTTHKKGRKYATILQVKVNSSSGSQLLNQIASAVADKKKFLVVTPNPEIIMLAQDDAVLYGILNSAEFSLPDGVGLVLANRINAWKSRVLPRVFLQENPQGDPFLEALLPGSPALIKERVSGVDMMQSLVKLASERGWRVFLLGGKPGVAESAANHLTRQYPNILVHWDSGPWLNDDGVPTDAAQAKKEAEVVRRINEFKPNLLFVGFGAPKQEKWASRHLRALEVNCVMVVGGSFDYVSGRVLRAPRFIRRIGLEWLFRLIVQPSRIGRQLSVFKFGWLALTSR